MKRKPWFGLHRWGQQLEQQMIEQRWSGASASALMTEAVFRRLPLNRRVVVAAARSHGGLLIMATAAIMMVGLIFSVPYFQRSSAASVPQGLESKIDSGYYQLNQYLGENNASDRNIVRQARISQGQTLNRLLELHNVPQDDVNRMIAAIRPVYDTKQMKAGQSVGLVFSPTPGMNRPQRLEQLTLKVSAERNMVIERTDNGFVAKNVTHQLTRQLQRHAATIQSSLFGAGAAAGIPKSVMNRLVEAYSYDVDFQRDIRAGDQIEVVFERFVNPEGELVKAGDILFVNMQLSGQSNPLYFYRSRNDTRGDFYTEAGQSVRKALMRTPVDGARISSGFGFRRHPVLGFNRAHKGVDFAAPIGTPIKAAGDGTIVEMGRKGAYGNYMRIRHNGTYDTAYAHISRFAKGMSRGKRVRQGDVIAFVGNTGMSTGPHLHFEVLRNNAQINPMKMNLPAGQKLAGADLERFMSQRRMVERKLADLRLTNEPIMVSQIPGSVNTVATIANSDAVPAAASSTSSTRVADASMPQPMRRPTF